jgi:Rod binding domain-containing protein
MDAIGIAMAASAADRTGTAPQPRLVQAAHEFEAQMMKELMKPLTASDGLTGDEGGALGSEGALSEFASEAFARALSERGGLGVASSIVRSLSHQGNGSRSTKVTGNQHGDTMLRHAEGLE